VNIKGNHLLHCLWWDWRPWT